MIWKRTRGGYAASTDIWDAVIWRAQWRDSSPRLFVWCAWRMGAFFEGWAQTLKTAKENAEKTQRGEGTTKEKA